MLYNEAMTRSRKRTAELTHIEWSWPALFLGPVWYLRYAMWKQAFVMLLVILVGSWRLIIPVNIYAALRFEEDLIEFKRARRKARSAK